MCFTWAQINCFMVRIICIVYHVPKTEQACRLQSDLKNIFVYKQEDIYLDAVKLTNGVIAALKISLLLYNNINLTGT